MNTEQVKLFQELVLTKEALGYKNDAFVYPLIAPIRPANSDVFKIPNRGTEHMKIYNMKRAPNTDILRVEPSLSYDTVSLEQTALDAAYPDEYNEPESFPKFDVRREYAELLNLIFELSIEKAIADILTTSANYDPSLVTTIGAGDHWDETTGTPLTDILGAIADVSDQRNPPNTLIVNDAVFLAMIQNSEIIDKWTGIDPNFPDDRAMARLLMLDRVLVAKPKYEDPSTGDFTRVWDNFAILCNLQPPTMWDSSFARIYRRTTYPKMRSFYDNNRDQWVTRRKDKINLAIRNELSGYLFIDPLS